MSNAFHNAAADASILTWAYRGYQRHSKVLSGEWRITNMPTPERLMELEGKNAPEPQALPDPTPG